MLEYAGEEDPAHGRDGRSLLDLLRGADDWRRHVVAEFHGLVTPFTQRMIVGERFKYVWNMGDSDELYDLASDPWELENLLTMTHTVRSSEICRHICTGGWSRR